jgi:hypothetical protein
LALLIFDILAQGLFVYSAVCLYEVAILPKAVAPEKFFQFRELFARRGYGESFIPWPEGREFNYCLLKLRLIQNATAY